MRTYVIHDDQSNQSFATSNIFDTLKLNSPLSDYTLTTLSSKSKIPLTGRVATGLKIKGINEQIWHNLPSLFENNYIPNTRHEVATPDMLEKLPQVSHLAKNFVPFDDEAEVCLLLGRDAGDLLFSEMQNEKSPFVHRTKIGWALVGNSCPNVNTQCNAFSTLRTSCSHEHYSADLQYSNGASVFSKYRDDEELGPSVEDKKFVNIMVNNTIVNGEGHLHLQMPLPFRNLDPALPNNQLSVYRRQHNTLQRMKNKDAMLNECIATMQKYMDAHHVEKIPTDKLHYEEGKAWYIPIFPVIHPKKKKARLVFDSAASYEGVSLNSTLLRGPNQNNDLRGVLLRFRSHSVAVVADIEGMYHAFHVPPEQRNYLRFYWFNDNDSTQKLVQYRARVHVFGNTSSPAVAISGMRKVADWMLSDDTSSNNILVKETSRFIRESFYVDDALYSSPTQNCAIEVLSSVKGELAKYKLRLHKIVSSHKNVISAFPKSELGDVNESLDLCEPAIHRTLGVAWNVKSDSFTFKIDLQPRPYTRRGILAVVNSIFDPIGLASPVTLGGKLLQRQIINDHSTGSSIDWDEPLTGQHRDCWQHWIESLHQLTQLILPRCFTPSNFEVRTYSLHVYSDASKEAIGYVIYLRSISTENNVHVAFVTAGNKVAPKGATSIPRLELCAAVEASKAANYVQLQLSIPINNVTFYTDSTVLLGYLHNEQRQFTRYVTRRIDMIKCVSDAKQWFHVSSENNPADLSSRPTSGSSLLLTHWVTGPLNLWKVELYQQPVTEILTNHILPETEETIDAISLIVKVEHASVFTELLERSNNWRFTLSVAARIISLTWKLIDRTRQKLGISLAPRSELYAQEAALHAIIKEAQSFTYGEFIKSRENLTLPPSDPLYKLNPILDEHGIIRVGGRLQQSCLPFDFKHPILIPEKHPVSSAILRHFHVKTGHQGRHITLGAIIDSGFYLQHGNRIVKKYVYNCTVCRRLRAKCETQLMASLPPDRTEMTPPFTNTGCDVMGPWKVTEGIKTRSSNSERKAWAVVFTCLYSRAVHVEMIISLDTPSFKNALRRFISIRGPCKLLRSDRGTNFQGAVNQELDLKTINSYLNDNECQWLFNPPHASHFGGAWERKIGQIRRAMDVALLHTGSKLLTRDELQTVLCEAAAIVNATPLAEVSMDPNDPKPITPAMLLTLKSNHIHDTDYSEVSNISAYCKLRWKKVQFIADQFWIRWRKSYLQTLQQRNKWQTEKKSLSVGDIVLMKDKSVARNFWPLGMIHNIKCSHDGLVRSAVVKIAKSNKNDIKHFFYERPIGELVLLVKSN